jgi:hypothetical protein
VPALYFSWRMRKRGKVNLDSRPPLARWLDDLARPCVRLALPVRLHAVRLLLAFPFPHV